MITKIVKTAVISFAVKKVIKVADAHITNEFNTKYVIRECIECGYSNKGVNLTNCAHCYSELYFEQPVVQERNVIDVTPKNNHTLLTFNEEDFFEFDKILDNYGDFTNVSTTPQYYGR